MARNKIGIAILFVLKKQNGSRIGSVPIFFPLQLQFLFIPQKESQWSTQSYTKWWRSGSRISHGRGANPWRGGENLLFGQFFSKNWMKMKEIRGVSSLEPPWIRPLWIHQCWIAKVQIITIYVNGTLHPSLPRMQHSKSDPCNLAHFLPVLFETVTN